MNFAMPDFLPALPEIFVLIAVCGVLLVDLFLTDKSRGVTYVLAQATLIGALLLTLGIHSESPVLTFDRTFVNDPMATVLKSFVYAAVFVVFVYSKEYLRERGIFQGEFYLLGLFGVLGMMIMISAHNLLTIYLGLELMSLSLYAMVAMQRDSAVASEAAMKYFILGAMASAILLYGMSMVYGVTGSLDLGEIAQLVRGGSSESLVLVFGLVFILIGIAFKLGAVPFHMWIPDVYHGSPTAVTLFISTAPKLAAFAILIRLLGEGLGALQVHWADMVTVLAVLSIAVGNVFAIAQTNIKRMLAYSGIAHVGFLLLGVLAATPEGYAAAMFYAIVYVIMTLGGFGMVVYLSRKGFEGDRLEDFKGLNERSPWFAFIMLVLLFSMAGVPPFLGFWAKLAVIQAVIAVDMMWLAIVAVLFSVIGAFFYLRVVKLMYFDKPEESAAPEATRDLQVLLSANGLAVLGLGLFPGGLMAVCLAAITG